MNVRKIIVALAALLLAAGAVQAADVLYTVTDLGGGAANGINNSGQVVGTSSGAQHAFLYSSGHRTNIDTLTYSQGNAINNSGQVIGQNGQGFFIYSNGQMTTIGSGWAYGINNSGQIVGGFNGGDEQAFLYSNGMGMIAIGGSYSEAHGINDSGQIVGYTYTGGVAGYSAFLYSNGVTTDLGNLGGTGTFANGINNSGQVVGRAYTPGDASCHAFLYNSGVMTDIGTLPGESISVAYAINNSGQVVGASFTNGADPDHAFLYSGGVMTDLNSLIDTASGWTLADANAINDKGQIVGYGYFSGGGPEAFLLSPIPEPATLALLALGGWGLVGRGFKARQSRHPD
jgi:probable HAF family extracellular repeat protein